MYTIRQATVNDVEVIRELADAIWWPCYSPILADEQITYMLGDIYSTERITGQIQDNIQTYLLLFEDETPVAFAAYSPREEDPSVYKMHKLYCLPLKQGKGYGRALIEEVIKRVTDAGSNKLDLNVNRYNKAKILYDKMDFNVIYEEDIPIGPYFMNDFVMRKEW